MHSGREAAFTKDEGAFRDVMRKAPKGGELDPLDDQINRIIAKTRYRGLARNRAHLFTRFALGNLFLTRRKLVA